MQRSALVHRQRSPDDSTKPLCGRSRAATRGQDPGLPRYGVILSPRRIAAVYSLTREAKLYPAKFIAVRNFVNISDVIIKRIIAVFLMSLLLCMVSAAAAIRAAIDTDVHLA